MPASSPRPFADTLVIGGGPGGLAVAAELRRRGVRSTVLERDAQVGASWRRHYDRLRLHTTRLLSGLPGLTMPRRYGRWVARADVVRYLERYVTHHRLDVRTNTSVTRIERNGADWDVHTSGGVLTARTVVVATGYNHTPFMPDWRGSDSFTGEILHAGAYRNAAPFRGKDVLVVGIGNTGAEIAVDLAEGGAEHVSLAVRTAPHIVLRSSMGVSAQALGILCRHVPPKIIDPVAATMRRLTLPDLSGFGLPMPKEGLYTRVARDGSIPVQDVGLINAVRRGKVEITESVSAFDGDKVLLVDGTHLTPDVLIVSTGYRRGLEPLVGHLGVLGPDGCPTAHGGRTHPHAAGLYFTGYTNPISGMFRELAIDARRIAKSVAGR